MNEDENLQEVAIVDEAEQDDTVIPERYAITSFGADYDVEGIVKRLQRGEIFIPEFQRDYVWTIKEASRFIESLLLGLPVPGIFLAKEGSTNKLYVIDGQQRIKTLQFFWNGIFNPKDTDKFQKKFKLYNVQAKYDGKTFSTLAEEDRITLGNSIIHATIVKQDSPDDDDTSVYHVFERLNTGGRKLYPQEIRTAINFGSFITLLNELNNVTNWRKIFGKVHPRLKDQELILRFLALAKGQAGYEKPMNEFLNKFCKRFRNINTQTAEDFRNMFTTTINTIFKYLKDNAFRPEGILNTAVFDSVMVGVWKRLQNGEITNKDSFLTAYNTLMAELKSEDLMNKATSDETNVQKRLNKSIQAFNPVL